MCDPGLKRRDSSECEEDSLPEFYMDSGLSTLRGSHAGYDSELEVSKGHEEEAEEERAKVRGEANSHSGTVGESSDTEVRRTFAGTWRSTVASLIDMMTVDAFRVTDTEPVPVAFHWDQESALQHMNLLRVFSLLFFACVCITGCGDSGCWVSIWIRQQLSSGMETVWISPFETQPA